ncbi:hypothetical protein [Paenibacillus pini]|uniref:Uncharacterized protein n=1 Tax=Paenibacillus pini JCM 16418 TaxID=1236976 RepID=W7Z8R6_9BACL|nr:hypothetical protein [Paenibacillus pini]GAF10844.1 hypothetical protein JCM16418_5069 [Paenibacillus pini JCM 16418]
MLRHLQGISNKNVDAMLSASSTLVRGQLVQKDYTNGGVIKPLSQEGLYFVDKAQIPTGLMSLEGDLSDYDVRFENIAKGTLVTLEKPISGERYATSEFVATGLVAGDYLIASTTVDADQGKLKKNASATPFIYRGTKIENGHTLAIVEIL